MKTTTSLSAKHRSQSLTVRCLIRMISSTVPKSARPGFTETRNLRDILLRRLFSDDPNGAGMVRLKFRSLNSSHLNCASQLRIRKYTRPSQSPQLLNSACYPYIGCVLFMHLCVIQLFTLYQTKRHAVWSISVPSITPDASSTLLWMKLRAAGDRLC